LQGLNGPILNYSGSQIVQLPGKCGMRIVSDYPRSSPQNRSEVKNGTSTSLNRSAGRCGQQWKDS